MDIESKIKKLLKNKIIESGTHREQYWIRVSPKDIVKTVKALRDEGLFDVLTDICGVDNFPLTPRFQAVYHLTSTSHKSRLKIKANVPDDTITIPSIVSVWKGANWMEREAYDMYGIRFSEHPNMKRILMHEDFLDYPQRKDFPLKGWREDED